MERDDDNDNSNSPKPKDKVRLTPTTPYTELWSVTRLPPLRVGSEGNLTNAVDSLSNNINSNRPRHGNYSGDNNIDAQSVVGPSILFASNRAPLSAPANIGRASTSTMATDHDSAARNTAPARGAHVSWGPPAYYENEDGAHDLTVRPAPFTGRDHGAHDQDLAVRSAPFTGRDRGGSVASASFHSAASSHRGVPSVDHLAGSSSSRSPLPLHSSQGREAHADDDDDNDPVMKAVIAASLASAAGQAVVSVASANAASFGRDTAPSISIKRTEAPSRDADLDLEDDPVMRAAIAASLLSARAAARENFENVNLNLSTHVHPPATLTAVALENVHEIIDDGDHDDERQRLPQPGEEEEISSGAEIATGEQQQQQQQPYSVASPSNSAASAEFFQGDGETAAENDNRQQQQQQGPLSMSIGQAGDADLDLEDDPAMRAAIAASLVSARAVAAWENFENDGTVNLNLNSPPASTSVAVENVDEIFVDDGRQRREQSEEGEEIFSGAENDTATGEQQQQQHQPISVSSPSNSAASAGYFQGDRETAAENDLQQQQHQQRGPSSSSLSSPPQLPDPDIVGNGNSGETNDVQGLESDNSVLLHAHVEAVPQASPEGVDEVAENDDSAEPFVRPPSPPRARSSAEGPMLCGVPVAKSIMEGGDDDDDFAEDGDLVEPDTIQGLITADSQAADPSVYSHFNYLGHDVVVATIVRDPEQGQGGGEEEDEEQGTAGEGESSLPPDQDSNDVASSCSLVTEEDPPGSLKERNNKRCNDFFLRAIIFAVLVACGITGYVVGNRNDRDKADLLGIGGGATSVEEREQNTPPTLIDSPSMSEEDMEQNLFNLATTASPVASPQFVESEFHRTILGMLHPFLSSTGSDTRIILNSSQHLAVQWLDATSFGGNDEFDLSAWVVGDDSNEKGDAVGRTLPLPVEMEERLIQRYILAVFYYSTGGTRLSKDQETSPSGWINSTHFLSSKHECDWNWNSVGAIDIGVTCDDKMRVTEINIDSNNLSGTLPQTELHGLMHLQRLSLSNNLNIGGPLPEGLGMLPNLRMLLLEENALTGTLPSSYGNLTLLEEMNLAKNKLVGTIPSEVSQMTSLINIWLNMNEFTDGMDNFCQPEIDVATFIADCFCRNFPSTAPEVKCSCCSICCIIENAQEMCYPNVPCRSGAG